MTISYRFYTLRVLWLTAGEAKVTVYTPVLYCAELQLTFKGKITREVADTLQYIVFCYLFRNSIQKNLGGYKYHP